MTTTPLPPALALADELESPIGTMTTYAAAHRAAALLRTQHEAIERKDALLRRMVDAWDEPNNGLADCYEVVEAIKQELSQ